MERISRLAASIALLLALGSCVLPPPPPPPHSVLARAHARHRDVVIATLPPHAKRVVYRDEPCWYCDGHYYRRVRGGYTIIDY